MSNRPFEGLNPISPNIITPGYEAFVFPACPTPLITVQPTPQSADSGDTAQFSITATSPDPVTYQWQIYDVSWTNLSNDSTYSGVTTNTLSVVAAAPLDGSAYRCLAINACGSTPSNSAELTINPGACFMTLPTLVMDGNDTPYAFEGYAIDAIQESVADCLLEWKVNTGDGPDISAGPVSATIVGTTLVTSAQGTSAGTELEVDGLCRCRLRAAAGLSVAYSLSQTSPLNLTTEVSLYDDAGALVDSQTDAATPGTTLSGTFVFTVPADGFYYILTESYSGIGPTTMTAGYTMNGGPAATFCTARAAWDEGGGVQYTDCPLDDAFNWDCTFETRQRGSATGTLAQLCGFSEYTSPSTPPKKYRTQTLAGFLRLCFRLEGCADGPFSRFTTSHHYAGSYDYSPTDCSQVNTQTQDTGIADGLPADGICGSETTAPDTQPGASFTASTMGEPGAFTSSTSATNKTWTGLNVCGASNAGYIGRGSVTADLSNEDTESDAITRLLASGPGSTWSSWNSSNVYFAYWQPRTAGFTFNYTECQYHVIGSGLTPGNTYKRVVITSRRAYGTSDPFVVVGVSIVSGVADLSGNVEIINTFPNARGWEYDITCASCDAGGGGPPPPGP